MYPDDSVVMDAYNATKLSSPAHQFGTAIRCELSEVEATPGAGAYSIKSTLGKVADSRIKSPPQFSLRSREALANFTSDAPGPGWYKPKQVNPKEFTASKFSFPKGQSRAALATSKGIPGPGAYSLPSSVGKQILSTKENKNAACFGTGGRHPLSMIHTDLGPGEYGVGIAACEKQVDSRKLTSGFVKFAKGARTSEASLSAKDDELSRPGPGTYRLPSGLGGQGAAYPFRAAPKPSLSGREKFGSPF